MGQIQGRGIEYLVACPSPDSHKNRTQNRRSCLGILFLLFLFGSSSRGGFITGVALFLIGDESRINYWQCILRLFDGECYVTMYYVFVIESCLYPPMPFLDCHLLPRAPRPSLESLLVRRLPI